MDKQQRIEELQQRISNQKSMLLQRINILNNRDDHLHKIASMLDDPHALVPNSVNSVEDWLCGHPFPNSVLAAICRNKKEAFERSLFSHTTMYEYHIVKCESVGYYRNKFNIKKYGY
nr:MAG TPA: hypothetical protein [Caudoviricetes sp.]